jgi:hypothetical protein
LSETQIKERPLLFNAEMVRAILDGRKTQTRRAVKAMALDWLENSKFIPEYVASPDNDMCPNGKIGDQIWVRETFSAMGDNTGHALPIYYRADGDDGFAWTPSIHMPRWASRIQLEITNVRIERLQDIGEDDAEAEGIEGINQPTGGDDYQDYWRDYGVNKKDADGWPWFTGDPIASFKSLWNSIYKNWDSNPWVWVIEFKVIKP